MNRSRTLLRGAFVGLGFRDPLACPAAASPVECLALTTCQCSLEFVVGSAITQYG